MVDSRVKGSRAETVIRDLLRTHTKLKWERTPGSGALNEKHMLKGDLYVPSEHNYYAVEVKHYKDDHFTSSLLTSKNPQLLAWWEQAVRQGIQMGKKPLLIFKFDRSKVFVAYEDTPVSTIDHVKVDIDCNVFYVSLLEEWLNKEKPVFIK